MTKLATASSYTISGPQKVDVVVSQTGKRWSIVATVPGASLSSVHDQQPTLEDVATVVGRVLLGDARVQLGLDPGNDRCICDPPPPPDGKHCSECPQATDAKR